MQRFFLTLSAESHHKCVTIETNNYGEGGSVDSVVGEHCIMVNSISPDVSIPTSVHRGQLAKWTTVTMTTAQQA